MKKGGEEAQLHALPDPAPDRGERPAPLPAAPTAHGKVDPTAVPHATA
jgi:hypothetical protein